MNLKGHQEFTVACNVLNATINHLEAASSCSPDYEKFAKSARALRERMQKKWMAGVAKGRKEGWFKK